MQERGTTDDARRVGPRFTGRELLIVFAGFVAFGALTVAITLLVIEPMQRRNAGPSEMAQIEAFVTSDEFVEQVRDLEDGVEVPVPEPRATLAGRVVDGVSGAGMAGAEVELCRTIPTLICLTSATAADGSVLVELLPGEWTVRAFPPTGVTDRAAVSEALGTIARNERRAVDLVLIEESSHPLLEPSGVVVDTDGNPVDGATVTLAAAPNRYDPFTPVPEGGALMSPSNRSNPTITGAAGTFSWDVLAGWYVLSASKPGCVPLTTADADPMLILPAGPDLRLVLSCG